VLPAQRGWILGTRLHHALAVPRRLFSALALVALVALLVGLAACGDDSSTSSRPVPTPEDLASASVTGTWAVTLTVDTQTPPVLDNSVEKGATVTRQYVFAGGCNVDTVDCEVQRQSSAGQSNEVWTRAGATLSYHNEGTVALPCTIDGADTSVDHTARVTFTLEITDAVQVGETWTATELAYKRTAELAPSAAAAAKGCPTGTQTESGTGVPADTGTETTGVTETTGGTVTTVGSSTTGP
jgi:hypothetical protein